jgi:protein involved in polysaccharide export with SLBB domain
MGFERKTPLYRIPSSTNAARPDTSAAPLPRAAVRDGKWQWLVAFLLLAGCAQQRPLVHQALKINSNGNAAGVYTVRCPDVLDVLVAGQPNSSGKLAIGPDGRIELGTGQAVRVEGLSESDCALRLAEALAIPADRVHVRVADYKSRHIYVFGPEEGKQQAIPYRGPETVFEFLDRTGNLKAVEAQAEVYVVRTRLSEGLTPELFRIAIQQSSTAKDSGADFRLQPFDQVYLKERRHDRLLDFTPTRVRPFFESLVTGTFGVR